MAEASLFFHTKSCHFRGSHAPHFWGEILPPQNSQPPVQYKGTYADWLTQWGVRHVRSCNGRTTEFEEEGPPS